ncbi:MAG: putative porin [Gammaproteobacteria bacterium]|nr:putative porin [Gammaproteobacteria bacterium]MDH5628734.1 putative porin [Gammaproteobacteria bacterium]
MKNKLLVITSLAVAFSSAISAEEYQTFTSLNYSNVEFFNQTYESYSLAATHYFDPKVSLGPLVEFEYINTTSNISAFTYHSDFIDVNALSAEFFGDNFFIGLSYEKRETDFFRTEDDFDIDFLGYSFNKNIQLIVSERAIVPGAGSLYGIKYNHDLEGNDYLGLNVGLNDGIFQLQTTYFADLGDDHYLKLGAQYFSRKDLGQYYGAVNASYYFSKMTSLSLAYDKTKDYSVGLRHFFNNNFSTNISYGSNRDFSDLKEYQLGLAYWF